MDRRAVQFSLAAVLAPSLAGAALALPYAGDESGVGLLFELLALVAAAGLVAPAVAVAHLRGWLSTRFAAAGLGLALAPGALVGLLVPALLPVPALGLVYAAALLVGPSGHLVAAAREAFPASSDLRSVRAVWAYLPGAVRLAVQLAAYAVVVVGSVAVAGLGASGLLSTAAIPGSAGAAAVVTLFAAVGLVAVLAGMALVGVPPLVLLSPFGGVTRGRVQRWLADRAGVPSRPLSWGDHAVLAGLGVFATGLGVLALVLGIGGTGLASVGAVSALPVWLLLAVVVGVRSHLAELFVIPERGTRRALVRRHARELVVASLFQLVGLTWLVGMGAFLGVVAGWVALHEAGGQGTWGPRVALALAAVLQAWVTLRSLVTLALLRVMFVRQLVSAGSA